MAWRNAVQARSQRGLDFLLIGMFARGKISQTELRHHDNSRCVPERAFGPALE